MGSEKVKLYVSRHAQQGEEYSWHAIPVYLVFDVVFLPLRSEHLQYGLSSRMNVVWIHSYIQLVDSCYLLCHLTCHSPHCIPGTVYYMPVKYAKSTRLFLSF